MEIIQIHASAELVQRLRPYQNDLAHLLELGLRCLEEKMPFSTEAEAKQRQLIDALQQAGAIGPNVTTVASYLAEPENQNWQPIQAGGKAASEIIIEQRRGLSGD